MNLLYIDIDIKYHAPTRNLIPLLLKKVGNVDFFGLGYLSEEIINEGIFKFIEKNGPYDFIIINEQVIWNSQNYLEITEDDMKQAYKKNYIINFDISKIKSFLLSMYDFFLDYNGKKVIFLLETDYYNLKKQRLEILLKSNAYLITEGKDFIKFKKDLPFLEYESFYSYTNDNWANFVREHDDKIISVSQFVGEEEFSFSNISDRTNVIEIPGTNYYLRKKAFDLISNTNYSCSKKHYMKFYKVLSKLGLNPYSNKILMRIYQLLFREIINNSKYVYTCGSGLEWPIRKFYEIPALGSVLFATPCSGYEKLGFIDGYNFISCKPETLIERIEYLESNPTEAQQIAKNGLDLIYQIHSLSARSRQIKESFEAIIENKFYGTYWNNGKFNINKGEK